MKWKKKRNVSPRIEQWSVSGSDRVIINSGYHESQRLIVQNCGMSAVYLGNCTVEEYNGLRLEKGQQIELEVSPSQLWAIGEEVRDNHSYFGRRYVNLRILSY